MPIYEYACAACAHQFEATQKITDPPLTTCAACGAPRAERQISASSFALRGGGWYVSDYGRKGSSAD
ncbi:MAG: zinc ribbon domain-containing protein [Myxococcales bacterium]|nr:zinc ribbon domain-containing protein [Myxococcales bacterium]